MPTYQLTYFDGRGRAEVSRLLFAKAGVAYKDNRIEGEQWGQLKSTTPFGSLPLLEVDGVPVAQSFTITNFLAKRFGLHGKTDLDEAHINGICQTLDDVNSVVINTWMEKDETRKAAMKKSVEEEKLPALLKSLNRIIEKNASGFFVGKEMTLADIYFTHYITGYSMIEVEPDLSPYPKLQAVKTKVETDPNIAKWIKNRPQTPF